MENELFDPLFVGLTRPATKWGIPLMLFMMGIFVSIMVFMVTISYYQDLLHATEIALATLGFILGYAYLTVMDDPFGIEIAVINFIHFRHQLTFSFWGNTNSYFPG